MTKTELIQKMKTFVARQSEDLDEWYGPVNNMYAGVLSEFLTIELGYDIEAEDLMK